MSVMAMFLGGRVSFNVLLWCGFEAGERILLDDDVVRTADDSETLALDGTGAALTDNGLVGLDDYAKGTSVVARSGWSVLPSRIAWNNGVWAWSLNILLDRSSGSVRLVVLAPVVLVDSNLATSTSSPRGAAGAGGGSLTASEVESLGQDDNTRRRVTKVRDQLGIGVGEDRGGRATTSDALGETFCGTGDTGGSGPHCECCKDGCDLHDDSCSWEFKRM